MPVDRGIRFWGFIVVTITGLQRPAWVKSAGRLSPSHTVIRLMRTGPRIPRLTALVVVG